MACFILKPKKQFWLIRFLTNRDRQLGVPRLRMLYYKLHCNLFKLLFCRHDFQIAKPQLLIKPIKKYPELPVLVFPLWQVFFILIICNAEASCRSAAVLKLSLRERDGKSRRCDISFHDRGEVLPAHGMRIAKLCFYFLNFCGYLIFKFS